MLTDAFPKLDGAVFVRRLRAFLRSPCYVALIALAAVFSAVFGLEIYCYWLYLVCGIVAVLFDEDLLTLAPITVCSYISVSAKNNPGRFTGQTLFSDPKFLVQLTFICAVAGVLLTARLVSMLIKNPHRGTPRLTLGFAALGLAYLLSGLFSGADMLKTATFGFVQIASLSFLYFFLYYSVNWERVRKDYCAMLFTIVGMALCVQIASMYFGENVFGENGVQRWNLYMGWGIHNNVGCVMAMMVPAPFYFAVKHKSGWAFTVLGSVYMLFVVLTQSRGAIVCGSAVYLACAVCTVVKSKGMERIRHLIVFTALLAALFIAVSAFHERLVVFFNSLIESGLDDSSRFDTYRSCWARFLEYPWFGAGFYNTPGTLYIDGQMRTVGSALEAGAGFMPPRSHNTLFQLLATGGVLAIACYLFHRIETLISLFKKPSLEKTIVAFSILALLLASLLDCHFFNFGPALLYGILLVFAEGTDKKEYGKAPPYWLRKKQ